jgi:hypothetical protein
MRLVGDLLVLVRKGHIIVLLSIDFVRVYWTVDIYLLLWAYRSLYVSEVRLQKRYISVSSLKSNASYRFTTLRSHTNHTLWRLSRALNTVVA